MEQKKLTNLIRYWNQSGWDSQLFLPLDLPALGLHRFLFFLAIFSVALSLNLKHLCCSILCCSLQDHLCILILVFASRCTCIVQVNCRSFVSNSKVANKTVRDMTFTNGSLNKAFVLVVLHDMKVSVEGSNRAS